MGTIQRPKLAHSLPGRYRVYLPDAALALDNAVAPPLNHGIKMAFSSDIILARDLLSAAAATRP